MSTANLPATITPTHLAWMKLADAKTKVATDLQNNELVIQGFLLNIETVTELDKVQDKIKQAKLAAATGKDQRMQFTRILDEKIYTPLMEFEKRNLELITKADNHERTLRIAAADLKEKEGAKDAEIRSFRAHISNEYFRIAAEYRDTLQRHITLHYTNALEEKIPVKKVGEYIEEIKNEMKDIKLSPFVKFVRNLITDTEAQTIFADIRKYDPADDLKAGVADVDKKFELYKSDLKNAEDVIAEAKKQQDEASAKTRDSISQEAGINNIVAAAVPLQMTGGAKVKKIKEVEVVESDEWALAVITNFVKNWSACRQYLKVKMISKCSIAQMAEAIGKLATENDTMTFTGLTLKLIKK